MRNVIASTSAFLSVFIAAPARACPVCNTDAGAQVRAGLTDANLATGALAVLLPFLILSGIAAAIHFGLPRSRSNHDDRRRRS
jgi:hypothetical protein